MYRVQQYEVLEPAALHKLMNDFPFTTSIIGFEMIPEKLEGKFKLSQTRSKEDRDGVVVGLRRRTDEGSRMVREWMEKSQGFANASF